MKKAVDEQAETDAMHRVKDFTDPPYLYGGEWGISQAMQYSPWPLYTGDGDRDLTEQEKTTVARHIKIWSAIERAECAKISAGEIVSSVGSISAPLGTYAYIFSGGFPN